MSLLQTLRNNRGFKLEGITENGIEFIAIDNEHAEKATGIIMKFLSKHLMSSKLQCYDEKYCLYELTNNENGHKLEVEINKYLHIYIFITSGSIFIPIC